MSGEIIKPDGQPAEPSRTIQVGRQGERVILAMAGRPIALFSAPEAAQLATLLIKHASLISSGCNIVQKAIDETFGDVEPEPIIHWKDRIPPPSPPGNS